MVCGALTPGSRCPRHAIDRGSSGKQATFRRTTLAKTGGRCARCGAPAAQAHHRVPLSEAGSGDSAANGEPLCVLCHRLAHRGGNFYPTLLP